MSPTCEALREKIRCSDLTYDAISAGAGVGRSWLDKFMQGRIPDPGISKIEKLQQFFDEPQLTMDLQLPGTTEAPGQAPRAG